MKNKPDIRFDGFNEDWEQRKLENVANFFNQKRVPIDSELRTEGIYPYYGATGIIDYVENYIFDGEYVLLAEDGANITTRNSPIAYITKGKFWLNNHAHIMSMINGNNQFLLQILEKQNFTPMNTGTAQPKLNFQTVRKMQLIIPQEDEQQKIGTFFQNLDNLVTLHQRELENYKLLKKGFLQKLFPSNGDTNPLIRFDGFTDAWELRRLSELFSRGGSGGTPRSTNKAYYNGKIPFLGISDISNSNGFIDKTEKYITEEGLNNSSAWIVPAGSISLAMYASVGKLAILNTDVATSQAFYNMVFNDENLRNYVYQSLSKANESGEWTKLISTGTQANLNADKVKNFDISKPTNKEEMAMISSFFMDLDNLITLHQRELDNYKELKKGFLQKMFV